MTCADCGGDIIAEHDLAGYGYIATCVGCYDGASDSPYGFGATEHEALRSFADKHPEATDD